MTRIDNNQQRVGAPLPSEPLERSARTAGTSAEAFAEALKAAQEKSDRPEAVVSQVAKLLAAGKLDPQAAVMLSLAAGSQEFDLSALTLSPAAVKPLPKAYVNAAAAPRAATGSAQELFSALKPHFVQAERETGVPWQIQAAQWALETGWGSATPKDGASGRESHNLFGVKGTGPAGSVESATTEFVGGRMVRTVDRFRAYNSYTESIVEHARLLTSDYYQPAHGAGKNLKAWTEMLGPQKLGYATDPDYSRKLWRIIRENGWDS
ncbi:MAG TPA: glucosaminidase domain-containing protein [Symbiobacteriaceae bacterium]|nr:glucosaminidase domain-containing protein [Symbiobacteriaceae bacterium]